MTVEDIRNKDAAALEQELLDLRREQFNLRMQRASGQLAKPHQMKLVRRNIARVKTVLGEKAGKA
jgi:large subunit ribosomal protein L29